MENVTLFVSLVNATNSKHAHDENNTGTENNVQGSGHPSNLYEVIVITVVYSVFCLLGVIGNGLVIWFGVFGMKKTVNVVWYLSLAAADFSFAFSYLLNSSQVLLTNWLFVKDMCLFSNVFLYINMVVSIFQITVISVDRCICVMFPVWTHNHRRPRLAFIIVLIIWIISIAVTIPHIIIIDTTDINNTTVCILNIDESTAVRITVLGFVFFFLLPFIIIISCYIVIILHLRKRMFSSSRPLKTTVAVITAFFIFWFPNHLFFLLLTTNSSMFSFYVNYYLTATVIFLMIINSCINPALYVFIGQDFKEKFCGSFQAKIEKAFIEEDQSERSTDPQRSHCVTTEEDVIG